MSDMFHPKSIKVQTRNSTSQLSKPSSKASGQKGIAYLAPSIWNELPSDMKLIPNLNTFKHKLKKWFLENLKKEEQNIYIYIQTKMCSLKSTRYTIKHYYIIIIFYVLFQFKIGPQWN